MARCAMAIHFGVTLHTRCNEAEGHTGNHLGNGIAEFPYQRIEWLAGDRREAVTDRTDEYAWEE